MTAKTILQIITDNDDGDTITGGNDAASVAAEWEAALNGDADLIEGYIAARCFYPRSAAKLHAAGITPEQAVRKTDAGIGGYADTIGYKVANGDLSISEAAEIAAD